jgi:hypothetical protein
MKIKLLLSFLLLISIQFGFAQTFTYNDSWGEPGMKLKQADDQKVSVNYSIQTWSLTDVTINRENLKKIELPGNFLPNNEGAPDLPGTGRFVALPEGASADIRIVSMQVETIPNVDISPAPRIPKVTDEGPLVYQNDETIWNTNAFYPAEPVTLSEVTEIRGVDVVTLGITPFQYNPVTKELKVFRDIEVEVEFQGGTGTFGEDRLRSRWWDPIMQDMFINSSSLPEINYTTTQQSSRDIGCEYLIIVPDDQDFIDWGNTLATFRNKQGIDTDVITITEIGSNSVPSIESYVDDIYNNWDIVPSAILLLGDYGNNGTTIISPIYSNYCASDNIYADVSGNHMPDIVFSRITARDADDLETMINKIIDYETAPPTDPEFYDEPITALGWQTERWFQICIETVGGFFRNELGKNPVRINEVYGGNPSTDPWSTAPNTYTIINYFGQNGLGYLPATPGELGGWDGGNATMINNAINDGAFLLLHRDHGYEQGWGEPSYNNNSLNGLSNDKLTFVYSVNCLTGKFNWGNESFTEKFHRMEGGALGLVAASEVSYSFVNDTYVWGAFDNMWPEFMPDYGSTPEERGLLPAFSNAAGKYFLQQSSWPYNTGNKVVTYNLFHHHGGSFSTMYSEVPQNLTVVHNGVVVGGLSTFTVQADSGALIALSVDGEMIGAADATGMPVEISISPQVPGTTVDLVVTKTNHFRYEEGILVISPDDPYVIYEDHELNDASGNGNGMLDYAESPMLDLTAANIGNEDASNVEVILRSQDEFVTITDSTEVYGTIAANSSMNIADAFAFAVADTVPDEHLILFEVVSSDDDTSWSSMFTMMAHAPVMQFIEFVIDDSNGNGDGRIDPGETVDITIKIANNGSSDAFDVMVDLVCDDEYTTVQTGQQSFGDLMAGADAEQVFSVQAAENTPGGYQPPFEVMISGMHNIAGYGTFTTVVGKYTALVIDMDPNSNSAPMILETFQDMDLFVEEADKIPQDMNDYKSVFLCLGIHYSNHELSMGEAAMLVSYLAEGGKLYMEGRTAWHDDPQTALHGLFNINAVEDTWFLYENIYGRESTFTDGMMFEFEGTNPYNNYYIEAEEPAFEILGNESTGYGTAVAHDAGDYKTIGATAEFGGLLDGEPPSTRAALMTEYLNFFGDILTSTDEHGLAVQNSNVSIYPNPATSNLMISFGLETKERVLVEVFNVQGKKIATLFEGDLPSGNHQVAWDFNDNLEVTEGIYIYRLTTSEEISTGKIVIQ